MLWEFLAADIERVEGIGAVGTVFEKVFFGLRLLLHGLVPGSRCVPTPLLIYQIIKFEYCTEVESKLILQR